MPKYKPSHDFRGLKEDNKLFRAGEVAEFTKTRAKQIGVAMRKIEGYKDFKLEEVKD